MYSYDDSSGPKVVSSHATRHALRVLHELLFSVWRLQKRGDSAEKTYATGPIAEPKLLGPAR